MLLLITYSSALPEASLSAKAGYKEGAFL